MSDSPVQWELFVGDGDQPIRAGAAQSAALAFIAAEQALRASGFGAGEFHVQVSPFDNRVIAITDPEGPTGLPPTTAERYMQVMEYFDEHTWAGARGIRYYRWQDSVLQLCAARCFKPFAFVAGALRAPRLIKESACLSEKSRRTGLLPLMLRPLELRPAVQPCAPSLLD